MIKQEIGFGIAVSEHCCVMLCSKRRAVSGQGQYDIASNDIVTASNVTDLVVPKFGPHEADVVIRHSEYVRDIFVQGSNQTPFVVQTIPLNPGLPTAFPWLSQIAANYEEYSLVQCIYTFKSTIAQVAVSNGQQGQILLATQYKVTDVPFADKESMMMYAHSSSSMLSQSVYHGVECDPAKLTNTTGTKFLRSGELSLGVDKKEYDHGILNVAISNPPLTYLGQSAGELWVSYTVVLRKPKLGSLNGNSIPTDNVYFMLPSGLNVSRAMNIPWGVEDQWNCSKNSFGSIVRPMAITFPTTQPAVVMTNGQPNPGSTADPLKLLTWDRDETTNVSLYLPEGGINPLLYVDPETWTPYYSLYSIELPDNFQGVCTVKFESAYGSDVSGFGMLSAGNIYPFRDIIEAEAYVAPYATRYPFSIGVIDIDSPSNPIRYAHFSRSKFITVGYPAGTDPQYGVRLECHIRVLPATNGLRNRVYVCTPDFATANTSMAHINVSVYNATLSQSINGSADRLELVNPRTSLPYSRI